MIFTRTLHHFRVILFTIIALVATFILFDTVPDYYSVIQAAVLRGRVESNAPRGGSISWCEELAETPLIDSRSIKTETARNSLTVAEIEDVTVTTTSLHRNKSRVLSGVFQPVFVSANLSNLFVYSAWFDQRVPNEVRLIGVNTDLLLPHADNLTCVFREQANWKKDSVEMVKTPVKRIWEIHSYHRTSFFISCQPAEVNLTGNWTVSIASSANNDSCILNELTVNKIRIREDRQLFAVCVQPLHSEFNNVHKLVEMIELNRLFGANYFYFYNNSISANVSRVLRDYTQQTGSVAVVQWHFEDSELLGFGAAQMAALADCQRRAMQKFKYLVHTDLDDFIVLRTQKNWLEFHSLRMANEHAGQYVFANAYFVPTPGIEIEPEVRQLKLQTLASVTRSLTTLPFMERTKTIALAECVDDHYVHFVECFLQIPQCVGLKTVQVNPNIGILHHYRDETFVIPANEEKIIDTYLKNLVKEDLIAAVRRVLARLEQRGVV